MGDWIYLHFWPILCGTLLAFGLFGLGIAISETDYLAIASFSFAAGVWALLLERAIRGILP